LRNCILIICSILFWGITYAQDVERPKVGLVLSGGSAHGLVHIGVLKYLEREGIPVDYITGTSMGSIVGGLYATGMLADEIEELAATQAWDEILATNIPLDEVAPSEKYYHNRYAISLEVKNGNLSLPQGFFNSQKLDLSLNRMFRAAHQVKKFDELPYPFKCIAVDIETGEIVVLDEGYLGNAVRASMAIPSVFTPYKIEDHYLVDGGLRRNFPVQEVIEMGADIVIGVYVGSRLDRIDKLNSLVSILGQSAFMMGILDSEEQKKNTDVLIEPDVKELPSFGFDLYQELIDEGYRAARSQKPLIDSLKTIFSSYDIKKKKPLRIPEEVGISRARFPLVEEPFDDLAIFKFGQVKYSKNESISFDEIESGISRVFGTKHFENINYSFKDDAHGGLMMDLLAKPRKVNAFSIGLNYMPTSATAFIVTNELRNVLTKPSVLYSTVRIAENWAAKLDYKYRLGRNKDFLFTSLLKGERYHQRLYKGTEVFRRLNETNLTGRIGVGYEPNNVLFLNGYMGLNHFNLKSPTLQEEGFSDYKRLNGELGMDLSYQTIDDIYFATRGINLTSGLSYHHLLNQNLKEGLESRIFVPQDKSYAGAFLKFDIYTSVSPKLVAQASMNFGWKSNYSLTDNYRLGGLEDRNAKSISMIGLVTHQLHFKSYSQVGVALRWHALKSIHFTFKTERIEGLKTFNTTENSALNPSISFWSYGSIISLSTPLGPFSIAYGRNTLNKDWNSNFSFGYTFF
jgi:NTE family protein